MASASCREATTRQCGCGTSRAARRCAGSSATTTGCGASPSRRTASSACPAAWTRPCGCGNCRSDPGFPSEEKDVTSHPAVVSRRELLCLGAAAAALGPGLLRAADADDKPPNLLIGYTEFRTDLPGGRYVNVASMRAVVVKADGTGRRVLAEDLTREAGSWTQFVGWSPDGKAARLSRNWKSEEVGKWEEEHKDFRRPGEGVRHDMYLVDLASGKATKQTPVEDKKKSELIKNLVHGRSISPDGKRCAFEDPAYRLYLA